MPVVSGHTVRKAQKRCQEAMSKEVYLEGIRKSIPSTMMGESTTFSYFHMCFITMI
jgi:hypothetical protein